MVENFPRHFSRPFYLRKIPDPLQEFQNNPWCAAGPSRKFLYRITVNLHMKRFCAPLHNFHKIFRGIVDETVDDAETVTQRSGEKPAAGSRADDRKARKVQADRARRRAFTDDDIKSIVFHSRIQCFLHHLVEPVNLIDKQNIVFRKAGQNGR